TCIFCACLMVPGRVGAGVVGMMGGDACVALGGGAIQPPIFARWMPDTQRKRDNTMSERAFPFIRMNEREGKPRTRAITEIRGPYYTPMGKRYLEDVLETMGEYIDSLKFAGGSFT